MFLAYNIALVGESRAGINGKLEMWRQALKAYGFQLSISKTKYEM